MADFRFYFRYFLPDHMMYVLFPEIYNNTDKKRQNQVTCTMNIADIDGNMTKLFTNGSWFMTFFSEHYILVVTAL